MNAVTSQLVARFSHLEPTPTQPTIVAPVAISLRGARFFPTANGLVVFSEVNGRTVSRFYPHFVNTSESDPS